MFNTNYLEEKVRSKLRSDDRIVVLKPIEGQNVKATSGLVDNRLFTGGNTLHIVKDPFSNMWGFKYESGVLPQPLKQKFTSYTTILKYAEQYFKRRGLQIVEVVDHYAEN